MPTESYRNKSTVQRKTESIQLLTFKLDDQEYALSIANVVQVVRMVALTHPPKAPNYIEGLFNLRGKIVPVINVRARYGLPTKKHDLDTQLLIAKANGHTMAITVDAVSEVLTMPIDHIEPPEAIGPEMEYLSAVGKVGDRLILILDPNLLMTDAAELTHAYTADRMEIAA